MGQQQLDEICYIRKVDWDSLPVEAKNNRLASYKFILIKETGVPVTECEAAYKEWYKNRNPDPIPEATATQLKKKCSADPKCTKPLRMCADCATRKSFTLKRREKSEREVEALRNRAKGMKAQPPTTVEVQPKVERVEPATEMKVAESPTQAIEEPIRYPSFESWLARPRQGGIDVVKHKKVKDKKVSKKQDKRAGKKIAGKMKKGKGKKHKKRDEEE